MSTTQPQYDEYITLIGDSVLDNTRYVGINNPGKANPNRDIIDSKTNSCN